MAKFATTRARDFYAQTYDVSVSDWPGEIAFYMELAGEAQADGRSVLEVACGTGRVALRLARAGVTVIGLDISNAMLALARKKSVGLSNVRWVQADMREFDLGQTVGVTFIPGHSFQNLVTAVDQATCLDAIRRHLVPEGRLVIHLDHQDVSWLGELRQEKGGLFKIVGTFSHPRTGRQIRTSRAWSYESTTQTAIAQTVWEEIGANGQITDRLESGPIRLHCVFPFEMKHLLARTGFVIEAVYGSFFRDRLTDESAEMIWVARKSG